MPAPQTVIDLSRLNLSSGTASGSSYRSSWRPFELGGQTYVAEPGRRRRCGSRSPAPAGGFAFRCASRSTSRGPACAASSRPR